MIGSAQPALDRGGPDPRAVTGPAARIAASEAPLTSPAADPVPPADDQTSDTAATSATAYAADAPAGAVAQPAAPSSDYTSLEESDAASDPSQADDVVMEPDLASVSADEELPLAETASDAALASEAATSSDGAAGQEEAAQQLVELQAAPVDESGLPRVHERYSERSAPQSQPVEQRDPAALVPSLSQPAPGPIAAPVPTPAKAAEGEPPAAASTVTASGAEDTASTERDPLGEVEMPPEDVEMDAALLSDSSASATAEPGKEAQPTTQEPLDGSMKDDSPLVVVDEDQDTGSEQSSLSELHTPSEAQDTGSEQSVISELQPPPADQDTGSEHSGPSDTQSPPEAQDTGSEQSVLPEHKSPPASGNGAGVADAAQDAGGSELGVIRELQPPPASGNGAEVKDADHQPVPLRLVAAGFCIPHPAKVRQRADVNRYWNAVSSLVLRAL